MVDRTQTGQGPRWWQRLLSRPVDVLLDLSGLPRVEPPAVDPGTAAMFRRRTDDVVHSGGPVGTLDPPAPAFAYLSWLAAHHPVLFHGSKRGDLSALRMVRESSDVSEFGNQQAVFASDDPVWAMFFAVVDRGSALTSMRNGSVSTIGSPNRRHYYFSVNERTGDNAVLGSGSIYVLPRCGFRSERPHFGVLYTSHWVSDQPVRPLFRVAVSEADFPFAARIGRHQPGESMLRTLWKARRR